MEYHVKRKRMRSPSSDSPATGSGSRQPPPDADVAKRARLSTEGSIARRTTIHCVNCSRTRKYHETHNPRSYYLHTPALIASDHPNTALHGRTRLQDMDQYLEECVGFSIVILLDYDCEAYHEMIDESFKRLPMPLLPKELNLGMRPYFRVLEDDGPIARATAERLYLSESLRRALLVLQDQHANTLSEWNFDRDLVYPYSKLYSVKESFVEPSTKTLEPQQQTDLKVLYEYIIERLALNLGEMEELSAARLVSQKHWLMLFRPNDIVVTIRDGQYCAFTVRSCRLLDQNTLTMDCWSWEYDGNFFRKDTTLTVDWPTRSMQAKMEDLSVYPISQASEGIESGLRRRGEIFWSCRRRRYVNHDTPLQGLGSQLVRSRSSR